MSHQSRLATSMAGSETPYIVFGIDFGTTFSGVSWKWSGGSASPEPVRDWSTNGTPSQNRDSVKVPTSILYDSHGNVKLWGYIGDGHDGLLFQWFKLILSDEAQAKGGDKIDSTKELLKTLGKSVVDVVADYLRKLWEHTLSIVRGKKINATAFDNMQLRIVLTVPANWDHSANQLMKQAAAQAGMLEPRFAGPTTLRLVTEPEAAALAAWQESALEWQPDFKLGDSFVVCDAGGGTVDLISYKVNSLSPLKLEESVESTAGFCGAVYLDERFESAITTKIGLPAWNKISPAHKAKTMNDEWEHGIKRSYDGVKPSHFVEVRGYKPNRTMMGMGKRHSNTIEIHNAWLAALFTPICNEIVDLVRAQCNEVREVDSRSQFPKAILLVGGFGENSYLYSQLVKAFRNDNISILRPTGSWSAISRGAVYKGLSNTAEEEAVTNHVSKFSYGVQYAAIFDASKHQSEDKYLCKFTGRMLARNQLQCKSQTVEYGWIRHIGNKYDLSTITAEEIFISDAKKPPTRKTNDVKKCCTIKTSFSDNIWESLQEESRDPASSPQGLSYSRRLEYGLKMSIAAGKLDWLVFRNGGTMGQAEIVVEYE
ncbi:hypothetical protein BP6252_08906 [Coleophoma cylindrospora]|uniref:Actin-like ATPase domain-containing protein n=1 Tax=Coleophoma cylindrospora TaxID=1849047 RepID=A0A3D8R0Q3_9HELO|nr:hypothetical protein BP6252_08906 [Coleophoma cylindrospora]